MILKSFCSEALLTRKGPLPRTSACLSSTPFVPGSEKPEVSPKGRKPEPEGGQGSREHTRTTNTTFIFLPPHRTSPGLTQPSEQQLQPSRASGGIASPQDPPCGGQVARAQVSAGAAESQARADIEGLSTPFSLSARVDALNQQCLETIAMLDIQQQKLIQESMCLKSGSTEVTGLELAVLGACVCNHPGGQPCSCSKTAATARKQLLQLKQELDLLKKSKEEAYIMADAFRIAFEQQLMRRNEETLKLMQVNKICKKSTKWLNWKHPKDDGFVSQKKNFGQKLMDILTSEANSKKKEELDNHQEIFRILIDLLNDKEEALAHQRKVSYMLARELEEKDAMKNKDQEPVKEDSPCENHSSQTSESPSLFDPICSNFHIFNSRNCICSVLNHNIDASSLGTLKKSHSLPSRVRFFEEIQVEETYEITTGSSL
ncbi:coiled-coil domain-containing protein 125 [Gracilinanus agilis]|uniref:coiled-coil domain-containing protein 125 n=1 Tax=Gracilinanus agilis TaxID=191870 RepID=UPI001CFD853D|nr:coiled-coil domain-containing protein 125 [Gracilinanus agilis]